MVNQIIKVIENILDEGLKGKIKLDTNLSDVNINSITFIKIIVALETEFDFEFDDEMLTFTAFPTIKSFIEYVETKSTQK